MTSKKPSFNVSPDGYTVEVDGTIYSLEPRGNKHFHEIVGSHDPKDSPYRSGTLGEQLKLFNAALRNCNVEQARRVRWPMGHHRPFFLSGDGIILRPDEGALYFVDGLDKAAAYHYGFSDTIREIDSAMVLDRKVVGSLGSIAVSVDGLVRRMTFDAKLVENKLDINTELARDYITFFTGRQEAHQEAMSLLDELGCNLTVEVPLKGYAGKPVIGELMGAKLLIRRYCWIDYASGKMATFLVKK